jgi:hypothetical protein
MEVVEAELQLIVIEPFGAPAKLAALQLLNDEPEAFDLRLRRCEVDAFGRERPDHPPQRVYIIWQSGKIDVHEQSVYTDSRASSPTHMPVESIGRSDYPATAGRHCRSGARQSTPSISIDNCAEVSISVPPGSTFDGHRNTPCSSRLVKRQRPLPSQYTILMRWAFRPRNTKRWPEKGSWRRTP